MRPPFVVRAGLLLARGAAGRAGGLRAVEDSHEPRQNMVGVLLGPWPPITNRVLTSEQTRLLLAFGLLLAVNLALGTTFHYRVPWEKFAGYGGLLLVGAKVLYTFAVYRTSRVLRQPLWTTAIYIVLAPIAGFELIPIVGLLIGVRMARGALDERPS